jgi:hypothetical protein
MIVKYIMLKNKHSAFVILKFHCCLPILPYFIVICLLVITYAYGIHKLGYHLNLFLIP